MQACPLLCLTWCVRLQFQKLKTSRDDACVRAASASRTERLGWAGAPQPQSAGARSLGSLRQPAEPSKGEGEGATEGEDRPPPPDQRTWFQKNWIFVLPIVMLVTPAFPSLPAGPSTFLCWHGSCVLIAVPCGAVGGAVTPSFCEKSALCMGGCQIGGDNGKESNKTFHAVHLHCTVIICLSFFFGGGCAFSFPFSALGR